MLWAGESSYSTLFFGSRGVIAGVINYLLVIHDLTYKDKLIRMGAGSDLTGKNHMAAKICAIAYYGGLIVYTFLTFKI